MTDPASGIVQRARLLIDLHRADEAVELLHRALAAAPDSQPAWCELARAEVSRGNRAAALGAADRALGLDPDHEWPHRIASIVLSQLGRHDDAVRAARTAVRAAPDTWQCHVRLAETLVRHPQAAGTRPPMTDEAWAAACRSVELAPLEPDTHCTVGHLMLRRGQPDRAEAAFREALRLEPGNARALNALGLTNMRRGRLVTAAADFGAAVAADPHDRVARRNISAAAWNSTRYLLLGLFAELLIVTRSHGAPQLSWIGRIGSLLVVVALLVLGGVTWGRVPRRMRGYLLRLPRQDRWLGGLLLASILAVVLVAMATFAPTETSGAVLAFLGGIGFLAAICLRFAGLRRHNSEVDRIDGSAQ